MRGKLTFLAGVAAGFVLGTRAGREKYDELVSAARKLLDSPSVHEATGVVQAQATKLYGQGKDTLAHSRFAEKLRHQAGEPTDEVDTVDGTHQHMSPNSF